MDISTIPYIKTKNEAFNDDADILIKQSMFDNIEYQDGKTTITFINCVFNRKLIIRNSEIIDFKEISVYFFGCFIRDLEVDQIVSPNISIHFGTSIISGRIKSEKLLSVGLNNTLFAYGLFLIDVASVHISYSEENIFPKIWKKILRPTGLRSLEHYLRSDHSIYLENVNNFLFECRERSSNTPSGFYLAPFQFGDSRLRYYMKPGEKRNININLSIRFQNNPQEGSVKILSSNLNSLTLEGYSSVPITVENTSITEWYIRNFSPSKDTSFYNIRPGVNVPEGSHIEFHKSKLDSAWFDNVDFGSYNVVSFFRTKFSKATFSSCVFPETFASFEKFKNLPNVHYPNEVSESYYKDQYETFLQLKSSLESSGNFYEAQKFQAISNDLLSKVKNVSGWDKAILRINSLSNNHGLSIWQPLAGFFVFSIILYVLYLFSLGLIFTSNDIDYTLIGYYFSFIDITHRTDFLVDKTEFNLWALSIDFFGKVIGGFFIYQFIAAFRKYGKSR